MVPMLFEFVYNDTGEICVVNIVYEDTQLR